MMKASVLLACVLLLSPFALGDETELPAEYKPFQGRWKVMTNVKVAPINLRAPEIYVDVVGNSFVLHGPSIQPQYRRAYEFGVPAPADKSLYQRLHDQGIGKFADVVDTPNQIAVFWFIGIHRFVDDRLELCLRYWGQGVEGEEAQNFRPPSSFDENLPTNAGIITLERTPVDDDELLTKDSIDG